MHRTVMIALLGALLVGSCDPYVYDPKEFDRTDKNFGHDIVDRTGVQICYNVGTSTPQDVLAMAEAECSKFGRTASYNYTDVLECPIATPNRAMFSCLKK
jgi:hypothetical protein